MTLQNGTHRIHKELIDEINKLKKELNCSKTQASQFIARKYKNNRYGNETIWGIK